MTVGLPGLLVDDMPFPDLVEVRPRQIRICLVPEMPGHWEVPDLVVGAVRGRLVLAKIPAVMAAEGRHSPLVDGRLEIEPQGIECRRAVFRIGGHV